MSATETTFENPPTYRVVRGWLEGRLGREWRAGQRLPTIAQLSKELGVGYVNIQRALRELADAGLVVSRRGAGTFVHDSLPPLQPMMRSGTVHSSVPDLHGKRVRILAVEHPDEFLVRMIRGFSSHMEDTGCQLERLLFNYKNMDLRSIDADALVLLNPDFTPDIYFGDEQLLAVINTAVETPVGMPGRFDVVSVEQEHGGLLAGRRLREAGIEDACYVGAHIKLDPRPYDTTSAARLKGFERGFGKTLRAEHRFQVATYSVEVGARAVQKYLQLKPRPEGVFTASDELAVGFILGALTHGLEPGRDYHIVGFDGQQLGRELHSGPLTTVEVPAEEMGRRAARLLTDRFANPDQPVRRLLLGCTLFEGTTVRRRDS